MGKHNIYDATDCYKPSLHIRFVKFKVIKNWQYFQWNQFLVGLWTEKEKVFYELRQHFHFPSENLLDTKLFPELAVNYVTNTDPNTLWVPHGEKNVIRIFSVFTS